MNLEYLKTFTEIVRSGSFSDVAKKLSISQPAVSFQIQKLERELGIRLLDRNQKIITPTEAGRRLLRFAELVEKEQKLLVLDLEHLRSEVTGELHISASTIPGEMLIPSILGEFKALHPDVRAQVDICDSATVISRIFDATSDVGFCGIPPSGNELDCFRIASDEIVLIVFPEHPFSQRDSIKFVELEGEPFIMRENTSGTHRSLISLLEKEGMDIHKLTPILTLGTTQSLISAVEARVGIAFVSNLAIKKSLGLNLVREVRIEGLCLNRDFYCVFRRERTESRLIGEFINYVNSRAV